MANGTPVVYEDAGLISAEEFNAAFEDTRPIIEAEQPGFITDPQNYSIAKAKNSIYSIFTKNAMSENGLNIRGKWNGTTVLICSGRVEGDAYIIQVGLVHKDGLGSFDYFYSTDFLEDSEISWKSFFAARGITKRVDIIEKPSNIYTQKYQVQQLSSSLHTLTETSLGIIANEKELIHLTADYS